MSASNLPIGSDNDTSAPWNQIEPEYEQCPDCDGTGGRDSDELMEEDPLWYDGVEFEKCTYCDGTGYIEVKKD